MITLSVQPRTQLGKKVRKIRKEGYLPVVLYGPKVQTTPLQISYKEFQRVFKEAGESSLVHLAFPKEEKNAAQTAVLIRAVEVHAVTRAFLHADFYQVPLDVKIEIKIPVEYDGDAPAVKDEGATLVRNLFELDVQALPANLPHEIRIDLTSLAHVGDSIIVKDLVLPLGVEIMNDAGMVVAIIEAPRAEEAAQEAPAGENLETIKTEAEEKRAEKVEKEVEE